MEQLLMSARLEEPGAVGQPCAPYRIRAFAPGDEAGWERIVAEAFGVRVRFDELKAGAAYRPERVFFAVDGENRPVATATCWEAPGLYPAGCAVLHMVGVLPAHRGHALSRFTCRAVMRQARQEDFEQMVLRTDDARLPAIRTYMHLGFAPRPVGEAQLPRWADVLTRLQREDVIARLPQLLWKGSGQHASGMDR